MKKHQQTIVLQIYGVTVLILGLLTLAWVFYSVATGNQLLTLQLLPTVISIAIVIYLGYYISKSEQIPIPQSIGRAFIPLLTFVP